MVCKKIADLTPEQAQKRREWRREWARKLRETDEHKEKWNDYYIRNKDKFREYFSRRERCILKDFNVHVEGDLLSCLSILMLILKIIRIISRTILTT
jgi:hypothetical protein